jgi:hypothetical protein
MMMRDMPANEAGREAVGRKGDFRKTVCWRKANFVERLKSTYVLSKPVIVPLGRGGCETLPKTGPSSAVSGP